MTHRTGSLVALVTLAVAACGGGGGSLAAGTTTTTTIAARASTTTTVAAADGVANPTPSTEDAPAAGPGAADLVGRWLGPMPGGTGRCGSAVSEWTLAGDGTYHVTNRSTDCGGFTVFGTYSADDRAVAFEQQCVDCPKC